MRWKGNFQKSWSGNKTKTAWGFYLWTVRVTDRWDNAVNSSSRPNLLSRLYRKGVISSLRNLFPLAPQETFAAAFHYCSWNIIFTTPEVTGNVCCEVSICWRLCIPHVCMWTSMVVAHTPWQGKPLAYCRNRCNGPPRILQFPCYIHRHDICLQPKQRTRQPHQKCPET